MPRPQFEQTIQTEPNNNSTNVPGSVCFARSVLVPSTDIVISALKNVTHSRFAAHKNEGT